MPGFAEHLRGSCGALAAAGSSESSFALQQAVDLVLQNGLGLSSLEGNPADSSTLLTVPPPRLWEHRLQHQERLPQLRQHLLRRLHGSAPSLEITQALGRLCDFRR